MSTLRLDDQLEHLHAAVIEHLADETCRLWHGIDESVAAGRADSLRAGRVPEVDALIASVRDLIDGVSARYLAWERLAADSHTDELEPPATPNSIPSFLDLKRGPGRGEHL